MEDRNPIQEAMNQVMQFQVQEAKLTIGWTEYGHTFSIESLNPIAALELMEKTKSAFRSKYGKEQAGSRIKKVMGK